MATEEATEHATAIDEIASAEDTTHMEPQDYDQPKVPTVAIPKITINGNPMPMSPQTGMYQIVSSRPHGLLLPAHSIFYFLIRFLLPFANFVATHSRRSNTRNRFR